MFLDFVGRDPIPGMEGDIVNKSVGLRPRSPPSLMIPLPSLISATSLPTLDRLTLIKKLGGIKRKCKAEVRLLRVKGIFLLRKKPRWK